MTSRRLIEAVPKGQAGLDEHQLRRRISWRR